MCVHGRSVLTRIRPRSRGFSLTTPPLMCLSTQTLFCRERWVAVGRRGMSGLNVNAVPVYHCAMCVPSGHFWRSGSVSLVL